MGGAVEGVEMGGAVEGVEMGGAGLVSGVSWGMFGVGSDGVLPGADEFIQPAIE